MTTSKVKKGQWKRRDVKPSDNLKPVPGAQTTDVIIPVMGPTGVGKSTFINVAAGAELASVGNDLESCTSTIQPIIVPYPGDPSRRIIFVDTPGFDDTYVDDAEILRRIGVWMAHSYNEDMKLAGVIYLHEISQTRMLGTSRRNFVVFNRMSGDKAAKDVVLATTKWSHIMEDVGRRRENQLRENHWKNMLDHGSQMTRFLKTYQSAWGIVDIILKTDAIDALLIQDELVNLQKRIPMTEAGTSLRNALQELLKEQKEMTEKLKKDSRENGELRERYEESLTRLRSTLDQIQGLKVSLGARIKAVFFP